MILLVTLLLSGLCASPADAQALRWHSFEEALALSDSSGRPVFVHVYAPWCGWCRKMERVVYSSEGVRACLAQRFVLTRLNRDDTDTMHAYRGRRLSSLRLAQTLRAAGVPTVVLLAPDGRYLLHLSGYVERDVLRRVLAYVATGAYRRQAFSTFREGVRRVSC